MGKPARYMFDEVFSIAQADEPEPPRIEEDDLKRAVHEARQEGYAAGEAAGVPTRPRASRTSSPRPATGFSTRCPA